MTDVVKYKLSFAEVEQGRPATVKDAAMCFKDIVYEYRDSLMAGLIVAGFDKVWLVSNDNYKNLFFSDIQIKNTLYNNSL